MVPQLMRAARGSGAGQWQQRVALRRRRIRGCVPMATHCQVRVWIGCIVVRPSTPLIICDPLYRISFVAFPQQSLPSLPCAGSSSLGGAITERPAIRYSDLGGVEHCLQDVRELIEYPLRHPEIYAHLGVEPPRGILLHGPPGTGKTMLANAIAGVCFAVDICSAQAVLAPYKACICTVKCPWPKRVTKPKDTQTRAKPFSQV
jgi:hypothetical protein